MVPQSMEPDEAERNTDHGVSHFAIDLSDIHAVVRALCIACGGRILITKSALMDSRSWRVACEAETDEKNTMEKADSILFLTYSSLQFPGTGQPFRQRMMILLARLPDPSQ